MTRRAIAFFFHAPGLWLFYRQGLPRALVRPNVVAVAATLLAMGVAGWLATEHRLVTVAGVWLAGHFAWGAYLARALPD